MRIVPVPGACSHWQVVYRPLAEGVETEGVEPFTIIGLLDRSRFMIGAAPAG